MHPNPIYRQESEARAVEAARERGFGVLTVASGGGVLAAHVPFLMDAGGKAVAAHLVRSNPVARALKEGACEALLIVSGPDGYVSPDWYGLEDQVPTWNYVAVHIHGRLTLRPDAELREHLDALSGRFEAELAPKSPWTTAKMAPDALARMMRQIVPVAMTVERLESTFKLNQNKPRQARLGAAAALEKGGTPGQEIPSLVALMRGLG